MKNLTLIAALLLFAVASCKKEQKTYYVKVLTNNHCSVLTSASSDWSESQCGDSVTYSEVPPGEYKIYIKELDFRDKVTVTNKNQIIDFRLF